MQTFSFFFLGMALIASAAVNYNNGTMIPEFYDYEDAGAGDYDYDDFSDDSFWQPTVSGGHYEVRS